MRHRRLVTASTILLLATPPLAAQVTQAQDFHQTVASKTASWQDREAAFDRLLGPGIHPWEALRNSGDALRLDLIQALSKDAAWARKEPALTEEFTDYQGNLIAAVASLRDPRSIDVLFDCIDTGDMALTALASFGGKSFTRALALLKTHPDDQIGHSALLLLTKIVQPGNIAQLSDPAATSILLEALTQSLNETDDFIRETAIQGLVQLNDKRALTALSKLAQREAPQSLMRQQALAAIKKLSER